MKSRDERGEFFVGTLTGGVSKHQMSAGPQEITCLQQRSSGRDKCAKQLDGHVAFQVLQGKLHLADRVGDLVFQQRQFSSQGKRSRIFGSGLQETVDGRTGVVQFVAADLNDRFQMQQTGKLWVFFEQLVELSQRCDPLFALQGALDFVQFLNDIPRAAELDFLAAATGTE